LVLPPVVRFPEAGRVWNLTQVGRAYGH